MCPGGRDWPADAAGGIFRKVEADNRPEGDPRAAEWLALLTERWGPISARESAAATASAIAVRHGDAGEAFARLATDPETDRAELFRAKNSTLALSVDSSLAWSQGLYGRQLAQLGRVVDRIQPRTVIDAGCEQGIVTCFVAAIAPGARVVGLDACTEAVELARELAATLGIGNVSFERGDLTRPTGDRSDTAELTLTSRAVLGEAIGAADDLPPELLPGELPAAPPWRAAADVVAAALAGITAPGGTLVSVERSGTSGIVRWSSALASAGFAIDHPVETITVDEPGNRAERFRTLTARLAPTAADPPPPSTLLGPPPGARKGTTVEGEEAERLALHPGPIRSAEAWEWPNASGDRERLELALLENGDLLELRCSTNGERSVSLHGAADGDRVRLARGRELAALTGGESPPVEPLLGSSDLPT